MQRKKVNVVAYTSSMFCGLTLLRSRHPKPWIGVAIATAVATIVVVASDLFFYSSMLPGYAALFTGPGLVHRIISEMMQAVEIEIMFRLICTSALIALFGKLFGCSWRSALAAIVLTQTLWFAQTGMPHGVQQTAYYSIRFVGVGCLWGWLYWRYSFLAALIAHPLTHLLLDPILFLVLR